MTATLVMSVQNRVKAMRIELAKAESLRDRFKTGPLRRYFDERVQQLAAEIAECDRSMAELVA